MSIDSSTIKRIAFLARIKIEDNEVPNYVKEVGAIFDWIEQLNALNTEDALPLQSTISNSVLLRQDEVVHSNDQDVILKNSPNSKFGYYIVPVVVE